MKAKTKESIKNIAIVLSFVLAGLLMGLGLGHKWGSDSMYECMKDINRDYAYEHYCDSIWITNPEYYVDVLMESDEYQTYVEKNGRWWDSYAPK